MNEDLPPVKGARYTMMRVSVREWVENFEGNNTKTNKGIPRYFYVTPEGDIKVWPKPDGPVDYMLTVRVE